MAKRGRRPEEVAGAVAERLVGYVLRYEEAHDSRAVFAYLYLQLTRSLAAALERGDPEFEDPAWVSSLAESLAAEYFSAADALDAWVASPRTSPTARVTVDDLPGAVPEPWRDVYAAISDGRSYVLEDALFSMMAHISYDLPIALNKMASSSDVRPHIADYHRMNDVLGTAIDRIQDELADRYCRYLADLDQLFARDDELFSNYGIRMSRGLAWYNFERLNDARGAAAAQHSIQTSTGAFIQKIRQPDDWAIRLATHAGRLLVPERRQWPPPGSTP